MASTTSQTIFASCSSATKPDSISRCGWTRSRYFFALPTNLLLSLGILGLSGWFLSSALNEDGAAAGTDSGPAIETLNFKLLEQKARAALPDNVLSYVAGGCGNEHTQNANVAAFERWGLIPRMMVDCSKRDMSVELFGHSRFPRIGELPYLLTLGSRGFYWFQLVEEDESPSDA